MTPAVGLGAGGHARVVIDALRLGKRVEPVALLDPDPALHNTNVDGVPVLGGDDRLAGMLGTTATHAFIGIGGARTNEPRRLAFERARASGFVVLTVVHPSAVVAQSATLGAGTVVLAGAVVNAGAAIGDNVIVNTAAIVEHDCRIGDHAHVATGARLGGTVTVGEGAHVGLGASVRQGIVIGRHAIVGGGAMVVDDVPDGAVVVGVPARILSRSIDRGV